MRIRNAALLVAPIVGALLVRRAGSLRADYDRETRETVARTEASPGPMTEVDLEPLPAPVRTYLRRVGVVGRPRVRSFHAVMRADMRFGPDSPWMPSRADQYEFFRPMSRFYFMRASRAGIPFVVLHRYVGREATMRVRLAGLVPVSDVGGEEMTRAETVTLLNDICVLAPAALVEAPIEWAEIDDRSVRATFTNAGHRVSAVLAFDEHGDLVGFRSDDRAKLVGEELHRFPWSTPLEDYHDFGVARLARRGEARWIEPGGEWAYGRFVLERIEYNVTAR